MVFNALVLLGDSFKIGKRLAYIVSVMMSIVLILTDNAGLTLPDMLWGFDRTFKYIGFYAVCNAVYEVVIRIAPWMVGKSRKSA